MRKKPEPSAVKAVLISIGTELTQGLVRDKHLSFIGQEMAAFGIEIIKALQIPDNKDLILGELTLACEQAGLVILSGGLGPTEDDLTREMVSQVTGKTLVYHQKVFDNIKIRFSGFNIPKSNEKQASCPEGFVFLNNSHGTAPGFYGSLNGVMIFALPGPPRELQPMFLNEVLPILKGEFQERKVCELVFNSYMISESLLQDVFTKTKAFEVTLATRLDDDRIIGTLRGPTIEGLETSFLELQRQFGFMRIQAGNYFIGDRLVDCLSKKALSLSLAESCTGGLISQWITSISGSSRIFWGSVVTYANRAKEDLLGVDALVVEQKGAVSRETAVAMVRGALKLSNSEVAISVTGIAGPDGGTEEKPVGTVWIALSVNGRELSHCFRFNGDRHRVRYKTAVTAMLLCQAMVEERDVQDLNQFS
ncbi:MAG: CinA family nicotinamide mononucleotide deamidase-related protein [Spirochaetales bacterium]|nr:CinA family nicotinamide mononucleotide deamidase-related protein [Spirochaetales bacterium]